ncbi:S9 family peptidase [Alicyclobacillus curvatus]|nr:S9 family peptidase [Alicyclobacillus curvatus]
MAAVTVVATGRVTAAVNEANEASGATCETAAAMTAVVVAVAQLSCLGGLLMKDGQLSYFSIEEMVALPGYSGVNLSADGLRVAYVERMADWDENQYVDRVWTYDITSKERTLVTSDGIGSGQPQWSPDGTQLAYIRFVGSSQNRESQLFVKSPEQSAGIQITSTKGGIGRYRWSPDGNGIYYLADVQNTAMDERKKQYGDFEYVDVDYSRKTLYYVAVGEAIREAQARYAMPKDLRSTDDDESSDAGAEVKKPVPCFDRTDVHVQEFDISPDGKRIAVCGAPSPNFEDFDKSALYLVDISGGGTSEKVKDLSLPESFYGRVEGQVHFAPSGNRLAFTYRVGDGKMFRNNAIAVYDIATASTQTLVTGIDEQLSVVAWTEGGLVVEWQDGTNRRIERIDENGNVTPMVTGNGVMAYASSVSRQGTSAAYIKATMESPTDVYVDGERITDLGNVFGNRRVSRRQLVEWNSRDGSRIEGVLCVPDDFDASKRYPLLLVIHGGPTWASFPSPTQDKYYPIEQFIDRGFIVLLPNYRGSSGYGEAFRSLNEKNLGIGDYEDVVSGVEFLVEAGYADGDRVGVMGWSQGGYISAFCTTFSRRFKAVSVGAGISNWVTYYVNTDIHPFTRHYLGDNPWNDMEVYRDTSPMTYIKQAGTPTLIQHGDKDNRVPLPNAFELYQGLRDVGVQTQLVVFKGMPHGSDKPGWNRAIMHQNYAWFCHHILSDPLDAFWLK